MISPLGPRPWPVHLFAGLLLANGIWGLIGGLSNIDLWLDHYEYIFPAIEWDRDRVIIAMSARFTIVCIPVVAIWGFASRIARWLLSVFITASALIAAWEIIGAGGDIDWQNTITLSVMVVGIALLFTPPARAWFRKEKAIDPETSS